jgi:deferrochelatase/peroxidase EfeB
MNPSDIIKIAATKIAETAVHRKVRGKGPHNRLHRHSISFTRPLDHHRFFFGIIFTSWNHKIYIEAPVEPYHSFFRAAERGRLPVLEPPHDACFA